MGWGVFPTWAEIQTALGEAPASPDVPQAEGETQVHILDVGQGDSILLCQNGHYALIDAGEKEQGDGVVAYLKAAGVEKLDYAVISHMHTDHMGGMQKVLETIPVETVILPDMNLAPTPTAKSVESLLQTIDSLGCKVEVAQRGNQYALGGAQLRVVTAGIQSDSQNNNSVGILFSGGGFSFLSTGDGEKKYEADLLESGEPLRADVFKAAHHGSDTSNTANLLAAVRPAYVAVSCGAGNDYGHPHKEPLARFAAIGAEVLRTDQRGVIVFSAEENGPIQVTCGRDE